MEKRREPIALRNERLFRSVICRCGPMQRSTGMKMTQDALLDAFILLFDECSKESLKKDVSVTKFINKYRSLVSEIKSLRVSLDDFAVEKTIGKGHFGEVKVVREKETNDVYAMKILMKRSTLGTDADSLFEQEHDIMCTNTSPWLTSMQYSFQDNERLYFIMDYHPGGDLFSLLDRYNGTLPPEMTKFYLAETALAIKALHQMGYVHRDIKPDNILLDRCGHVKLADFGSAARLTASGFVSQSMPVGTPEYIAPEILMTWHNDSSAKKKKCYGVECDYWSLGILAYEMIVGSTPFSAVELTVTYFNIMNHKKIKYPENCKVPDTLKDLIDKLLEDPTMRIKHEGLVKHPFFIDVDWNNIRNELPPFVPTISSSSDTSNFIEVERKKSSAQVDVKESKKDFSGKHLPFIGFTFSNEPESKNSENNTSECVLEEKGSSLESTLARVQRENHNLVSKLCEVEVGKTSELEKLQKTLEEKSKLCSSTESDRNRLMREVAKVQAENANLRRTLELERQDRKDMEVNALNLIRQNKMKLERDMSNMVGQLNSKIEELYDKLTESHTVNNELASKCDRTESELKAAKNEIEQLKKLEASYKSKMSKAHKMRRESAVGLESRIEKLASENQSQANILQQKLNEEVSAKNEVTEKMKEMEAIWSGKEAQIREEIGEYEQKIFKLESKINAQNLEIASLQVKLDEKPNVVLLEQQLEAERSECVKLRSKISQMEAELTDTTSSFTDHESAIAAREENISALEKEYRLIAEEKMELQKKLVKTKELEEENRRKLSSLEVVIDRLEEGVVKLESENAKLKQQLGAYSQPITSEAETRYQEKISILEDQIAKLENQLEKVREVSVLDKEALRKTQNTLWKTEKELSDAKIDVRIARRETITATDAVAKLNEEVQKMTQKLSAMNSKSSDDLAAEREKLEKMSADMDALRSQISERDWEIKVVKNQLKDFEELKLANKQLRKEYNEMCQSCKILDKQVSVLKEEKEKLKDEKQGLEVTKVKLECVVEDMKHRICSLEVNNAALQETGAFMDEQLEDYEQLTVQQNKKLERMREEKSALEKEVEDVRGDLRTCRQNLNEEKSFRLKAEQRVSFLENEIANLEDNLTSVQNKMANSHAVAEDLKTQMKELEERNANYALEVDEWKRSYEALEEECRWLKKETTTHLTNLYSLRESNYKLTHSLEKEQENSAALQDRICELQSVITEREAFHKQREVKDEATMQQQGKLISFLQQKLGDSKKKKTLSDVLFGSRSKENFPSSLSPKSNKIIPDATKVKTPKDQSMLPNKKRVLSEIVKSPGSQSPFKKQAFVQRMHHNIPHRFRNQLVIRSGKCDGCHSNVNRGTHASICAHCGVQAHPKCSVTIPKTCGLPDGFAKHYGKTLMTNRAKSADAKSNADSHESLVVHEGWVKVPELENMTWEKKYVRLEGVTLHVYEHEPVDGQMSPIEQWSLCPRKNQIIIGEVTDASGLPPTAKSDLPYVIKIALVPEDTCWPKESYHIMVLTPSDKPLWLSALTGIIEKNASPPKVAYEGSKLCSFADDLNVQPNCVAQISDRVLLLGSDSGLYSVRLNAENAEPSRIEGATKVKQITVAQHIGLVLMIAEEDGVIVETDYRSLVSNAEALSCVEPRIETSTVALGRAVEPCLVFSVSHKIQGTVYLTAGTSTRLVLLKWSEKNSQFVMSTTLETLHPCNCLLYTESSVIVGCDKFFQIYLKDFTARGSFPIDIFQVSPGEYLLCYNEFGVFVTEDGRKSRSDLKWKNVPVQFAFRKPYLFVVHGSSVEVVLVPRPESTEANAKSAEDSVSTTSTATIRDSVRIPFENPRLLGPSSLSGAVVVADFVSPKETILTLIDGKKMYASEFGSCFSLTTITDDDDDDEDVKNDGDGFSLTSSLVQSLYEAESSTPRPSDESESCNTYTLSDAQNRRHYAKKAVSFTQHTVM